MAELSKEEIARYSRHLVLPEMGAAGQKRLKKTSVLLIGTGGLGSPAALYLAAAGIGRIGLVDYDRVDVSNLQRQIIHGESTVGDLKVESAKKRLRDVNPHIEVEVHNVLFSSENALKIISGYDIVADGTDNFPTRYLVNDACVFLGKPNVYASIFRFEGQLSVFNYADGPCYRCLYPEPPPPGLVPSCAEGGVLGIIPGVLGTLQATEVIKIAAGIGEPMVGRLLIFDALSMTFRELKIRRDSDCVVCGENPSVSSLVDYQEFCGVPQNDHEQGDGNVSSIDIQPTEVSRRMGDFQLIDVREPHEWDICHIEGAHLIPLGQIRSRAEEIPRDGETVIYCKMGGRSMMAIKELEALGYTNLRNLAGGIRAWANDVAKDMPVY